MCFSLGAALAVCRAKAASNGKRHFNIGRFYKKKADFAEEHQLPKEQIKQLCMLSARNYRTAFSMAEKISGNMKMNNPEALRLSQYLLAQATHTGDENAIKRFAYKTIELAYYQGSKKDDKRTLYFGLKLAEKYTPQNKNHFKAAIARLPAYQEYDLLEALKESRQYRIDLMAKEEYYRTMTKEEYEADKGMKKAITIAKFLVANTPFKYSRSQRKVDPEAYQVYFNVYNNLTWDSKDAKKYIGEMFVRNCWSLFMNTGYYDYAANGRDTASQCNPEAYRKFMRIFDKDRKRLFFRLIKY